MNEKTASEKLILYAEEVKKMLDMQQAYFAAKSAMGSSKILEVRDLLNASIKQEGRVKQLTDKILSPQAELNLNTDA